MLLPSAWARSMQKHGISGLTWGHFYEIHLPVFAAGGKKPEKNHISYSHSRTFGSSSGPLVSPKLLYLDCSSMHASGNANLTCFPCTL